MKEEFKKRFEGITDFKEHPEKDATFLIIYSTGYESQREIQIVGTDNKLAPAVKLAKKYFQIQNPIESLVNGYPFHHYHVRVNTATEEGKKLEAAYSAGFDEMMRYAEAHPEEYDVTRYDDGGVMAVEKCPLLDDKPIDEKEDSSASKPSYKMMIMDMNSDKKQFEKSKLFSDLDEMGCFHCRKSKREIAKGCYIITCPQQKEWMMITKNGVNEVQDIPEDIMKEALKETESDSDKFTAPFVPSVEFPEKFVLPDQKIVDAFLKQKSNRLKEDNIYYSLVELELKVINNLPSSLNGCRTAIMIHPEDYQKLSKEYLGQANLKYWKYYELFVTENVEKNKPKFILVAL